MTTTIDRARVAGPPTRSRPVDPTTSEADAATIDPRIPLTIGVTGHRRLDPTEVPRYRAAIEAFVDGLAARYPHTPLAIVSPLAEGADRLPVEIALSRGHRVVAVLPMEPDDYARDFADVGAFRDLLARIPPADVHVLPPSDDAAHASAFRDPRELRYERVGAFVAAHCHVLLALWDGVANALPGGTGEVVRYKLTGRGPFPAPVAELLEWPDGGPVVWLPVRRDAPQDAAVDDAPTPRWLYPDGRDATAVDEQHRRLEEFNAAAVSPRATGPIDAALPLVASDLDVEQRTIAATFAAADRLSIHHRRIGDRVLKVLIALGIVMTVAYEAYSRLLPVRAMLGLYLGAFAGVCLVYVWHRRIGALQKHLDYRALAEGLRVRLFWSLAGVRADVFDTYLRKQDDSLQWLREALRPSAPAARDHVRRALVHRAWIADQRAYFAASARRLNRTSRWAKRTTLVFFAAGLVKTAILFVFWDHLEAMGGFGHWSIVSVGSLPIVGALIDALSDSMGYEARSRQHAILAGVFDRADAAYATLVARGETATDDLRVLVERLGHEALHENEEWLSLRRDRPMRLHRDRDRDQDRDGDAARPA